MQVIMLSYSRLVKVVEEYAPLKERFSSWNSIINSDNEKEYNDNSGATAAVMYERVLAFMSSDFTTLVNNSDKMYSTLENVMHKAAGLLCACETFPDILKGGAVESPISWQSRSAAPSLDILYLDDEDCKRTDYSGTISDQTDNVEDCCKVLPDEIEALRAALDRVETVDINVETNIVAVEECIPKELYTKNLYTAMKLYVAGINGLEATVINNLSSLIDENAKEAHMRTHDYSGESTDNLAFIKRAIYKDMGYTDEEIDAITAQGIKVGTVDVNFVKITDLPEGQNYGGNQHWYMNAEWWHPLQRATSGNGCGVIAAVNMYLYMTGRTEVTKAEFEEIIKQYYLANELGRGGDGTSIARQAAVLGPTGATPEQIEFYVEWMCAHDPDHPSTVKMEWDYSQGYETDYDNMKKQLEQGIPVVWAVFDWHNGVGTGDEYLHFYNYDASTNTYTDGGGASSHYVTVTAIYEKVNDDGSVSRMVEVSSTGQRQYIDYDEYIEFVSGNPANVPFSSITNTTVG